MASNQQLGDGIHSVSFVDGHIEPTTNFRYQDLDPEEPEDMVSFSDMSAVFSLILEWILKADTLQLAGARAATLGAYLDPVNNNRFGSNLSEIAKQAGCTRAALSKSLIDFRRAAGVHLSMGKGSETTDSYKTCQIKAIEAGTHASKCRKDLKSKKQVANA